MDNLIFCLNATVPIFAIIVLGRWLRSKNFFTKQTLTDIVLFVQNSQSPITDLLFLTSVQVLFCYIRSWPHLRPVKS